MLKKFEVCVIAVALVAVAFTGGYFTGRSGSGRDIRIEVLEHNGYSDDTTGKSFPVVEDEDSSNTATISELEALPGIGDTLAERIVGYRNKNGDFKSIYDIQNVEGIGEAKFSAISEQITVE